MGVRRERRPVSQQWSQMSVGRERVRAGGDSEGKGWARVDITAICCQGCVIIDFLSLSTANARLGLFPSHQTIPRHWCGTDGLCYEACKPQ